MTYCNLNDILNEVDTEYVSDIVIQCENNILLTVTQIISAIPKELKCSS